MLWPCLCVCVCADVSGFHSITPSIIRLIGSIFRPGCWLSVWYCIRIMTFTFERGAVPGTEPFPVLYDALWHLSESKPWNTDHLLSLKFVLHFKYYYNFLNWILAEYYLICILNCVRVRLPRSSYCSECFTCCLRIPWTLSPSHLPLWMWNMLSGAVQWLGLGRSVLRFGRL